ncbi:MAG: GspH/FimT family pseudopilin [Cycloclasticus sp.]
MDRNTQNGFTLIELLITVVVLSVLLALASPSFFEVLERRKVKGAAEKLQVDLMFVKTEAIKRNTPVRIQFSFDGVDPSLWCYGMKVDAACDCFETDPSQADFCEIDGVKRVVDRADFGDNVLITGNSVGFAGNIVSFSPLRGNTINGNAKFSLTGGPEIQVSTNIRGRVTICSNNGFGLEDC